MMRFSTWNWPTHPYDKTRGCIIGPFFGIMCDVSVPTDKGLHIPTVKFRRM